MKGKTGKRVNEREKTFLRKCMKERKWNEKKRRTNKEIEREKEREDHEHIMESKKKLNATIRRDEI